MTKGKPNFVKAFWQRKKQLWQFRKLVLEKYQCPSIYADYENCLSAGDVLARFEYKHKIHSRANKAFVLDWFLSRWPEKKEEDIRSLRHIGRRSSLFRYFIDHLEGVVEDRYVPTKRYTAHGLGPMPPFHDLPYPHYVVGCASDKEIEVVAPVYEVLADKYPLYAAAWLNKAELRRRQGKLAEAIQCAEKAVEVSSNNADYSPYSKHTNKRLIVMALCYLARLEGGDNADEILHHELPLPEFIEKTGSWRSKERLDLIIRLNRAFKGATVEHKRSLAIALISARIIWGQDACGPLPSELDYFDDCLDIAIHAYRRKSDSCFFRSHFTTEQRDTTIQKYINGLLTTSNGKSVAFDEEAFRAIIDMLKAEVYLMLVQQNKGLVTEGQTMAKIMNESQLEEFVVFYENGKFELRGEWSLMEGFVTYGKSLTPFAETGAINAVEAMGLWNEGNVFFCDNYLNQLDKLWVLEFETIHQGTAFIPTAGDNGGGGIIGEPNKTWNFRPAVGRTTEGLLPEGELGPKTPVYIRRMSKPKFL